MLKVLMKKKKGGTALEWMQAHERPSSVKHKVSQNGQMIQYLESEHVMLE